MPQAERRIRKLTLSASDHSHLQQARYCLEEAFRTASLPGIPPGAQLVIRRLELGPLQRQLPAERLAERISGLVRNLAAGAVCVDEIPAAGAEVVWFSDPLRPYQRLMVTLLEGGSAPQWYWRSLFPQRVFRRDTATIEWLLLQASHTSLPGLAPAHLIQAVIEAGRFDGLLPFITPVLAQRLMREAGVSPLAAAATGSSAHKPERIHAPHLNRVWRNAITTAVDAWGEADVRSRWLAWNALILRQPVWLACRDVLPRLDLAGWLTAWSGERVEFGGDEIPPDPPLQKGGTGLVVAEGEQHDVRSSVTAPPSQHTPLSSPPLQRGARGDLTDPPAQPELYAQQPSPVSDARFSAHAGFAFLIPVFQRLALSELLQRNPCLIQLDLPRQLLWAMALRLRLVEHDPVWQLWAGFQPQADVPLRGIHIPKRWPGLMPGYLATASLRQLTNSLQLLAGVYLRRYCRLSVRGLTYRSGHVAFSSTHWDVQFDINQTDLRLRRVALDTDPGWVPWLGRVLQFHYPSEG